jgi:hypothetical protein
MAGLDSGEDSMGVAGRFAAEHPPECQDKLRHHLPCTRTVNHEPGVALPVGPGVQSGDDERGGVVWVWLRIDGHRIARHHLY